MTLCKMAKKCTYLMKLKNNFQYVHFFSKSLERSPAVGDFYRSGIEIWAGFGPVRQLLWPFFSCFHEQKKFLKNILDGENKS